MTQWQKDWVGVRIEPYSGYWKIHSTSWATSALAIRVPVSSWKVSMGTLSCWMHQSIKFHRCLTGFRSGERKVSQRHQYLQHQWPFYTPRSHKAGDRPTPGETRTNCTRIKSDSCSEDLIHIPTSSQGTFGYDMEIYVGLQGCTSSLTHQHICHAGWCIR